MDVSLIVPRLNEFSSQQVSCVLAFFSGRPSFPVLSLEFLCCLRFLVLGH